MLNVGDHRGQLLPATPYLPALHISTRRKGCGRIASGRIESAKGPRRRAAWHCPCLRRLGEGMAGRHALDLVWHRHADGDARADWCWRRFCARRSMCPVRKAHRNENASTEARAMPGCGARGKPPALIEPRIALYPTRARIAELIHGGELGEIRHVNISNIGRVLGNPSTPAPRVTGWSDRPRAAGRPGRRTGRISRHAALVLGEPAKPWWARR